MAANTARVVLTCDIAHESLGQTHRLQNVGWFLQIMLLLLLLLQEYTANPRTDASLGKVGH